MNNGLSVLLLAGFSLLFPYGVVSAAEPIEYDFVIDKPQEKVFEVKQGNYVCGAGFVKAVQSHQLTNSDDLEFWCRDTSKPLSLDFKPLPKFDAGKSKSNIVNIDGKIVDMFQDAVWDDEQWVPVSQYFKLPFWGTVNFTGEYFIGDGSELFGFNCKGIDIVDRDGNYYGSIKDVSHVTVINDKVYLNKGGAIYVGDKIKKKFFCGEIKLTEIIPDVGAVYGFFPYNDAIITGGSFQGDDKPAALYTIGKDGVQKSVLDREIATEVYTYSVLNDDVYIGLYPSGDVIRFPSDGSHELVKRYFPASHSFEEGTYREIQSLVSSGGYLFAGVYPRGRFMYYDSKTGRKGTTRLFSFPAEDAQYIPFSKEMKERIKKFEQGEYDGIKVDDSEISSGEKDIPRRWGLFESAWGQRVSHIAIFSGKICVSTGSMGNSAYIPEIHDFFSKDQYGEYGRVYCVDRDRHIMTHIDKYPVQAKFVIGQEEMKIVIGDKVYAAKTPSNSNFLEDLGKTSLPSGRATEQ